MYAPVSQTAVVAVEFPGYGRYEDYKLKDLNEQVFKLDAVSVLSYLEEKLKVRRQDVIIAGRSMGGGPAINLATTASGAKALLLFCTFASLKSMIKGQAIGSIEDLFNNQRQIAKIATPTLICHGKKDSLISHTHAETLFASSRAEHKMLHLEPAMDHGMECWETGIIIPCRFFLDWLTTSKSQTAGHAGSGVSAGGQANLQQVKYIFEVSEGQLKCQLVTQ